MIKRLGNIALGAVIGAFMGACIALVIRVFNLERPETLMSPIITCAIVGLALSIAHEFLGFRRD